MHGTLEQLRDHYPGKWLLIELDGSEAEEGTVLAAHEDPKVVDEELERRFRPKTSRGRPLYVTYSIPEGQDLPAVALQPVPFLEAVMDSIRNSLGMRKTEIASDPNRLWNPHFYALFAQVHNTL